MKYYLIIDIGGTKTTSVVFNDQGEPITEFKVKKSRTYEGEDAVFQNTIELAYEVSNNIDIDYSKIGGLSREMVAKLSKVKPATVGEASRIPGVTPAAITAVLGYVKR